MSIDTPIKIFTNVCAIMSITKSASYDRYLLTYRLLDFSTVLNNIFIKMFPGIANWIPIGLVS